MNLQDWFIVSGLFIIFGLILDAIRRILRQRNTSTKLSFDLDKAPYTSRSEDKIHTKKMKKTEQMQTEIIKNASLSSNQILEQSTASDSDIEVALCHKKISHINEWDDPKQLEKAFEYRRAVFQREWLAKNKETLNQSPFIETNDKPVETIKSTTLVFHLVKQDQLAFNHQELRHVLQEAGFQFTAEKIFCYPVKNTEDSVFQIVNGVEPGMFDFNRHEKQKITILTCLMILPGPKNPVAAFETMIVYIDQISKRLKATVRDDQYQLMTLKLFQRYRQKVMKYQHNATVISSHEA
ncbi:MAG: hypothetical protein HAW62_06875 [Endozoicomonadaceae bacterium]|nr:hypothetical protein [Endozoicomonadaceae bacterium]